MAVGPQCTASMSGKAKDGSIIVGPQKVRVKLSNQAGAKMGGGGGPDLLVAQHKVQDALPQGAQQVALQGRVSGLVCRCQAGTIGVHLESEARLLGGLGDLVPLSPPGLGSQRTLSEQQGRGGGI